MTHEEELVAVAPSFHVAHAIPSPDNRRCAFLIEPDTTPDQQRPRQQLVLDGEVLAESRSLLNWSWSFDGKKLATAHQVYERRSVHYDIRINGKPTHRSDFDTVHYLTWISNDRLAWDAFTRDVGEGISTFVNGEDVTGRLEFKPILLGRSEHAVLFLENGMRHLIVEDGSALSATPATSLDDHSAWSRDQSDHPEEVRSEPDNYVRVSYRGKQGPAFDDIESGGGLHRYVFNHDRSAVGYIGIRYSGAARSVNAWVGRRLERAETREEAGSMSLLAWPLALLFNPYIGIGHAAIEGSRRFIPVVNDREWKKGYLYAGDHFFTPSGNLVVTASSRKGQRVVIDEEEGPLYDDIQHVRFWKPEQRLCYLARRGTQYFRVTVNP